MNIPSATFFHLEGAARPIAAHWFTTHGLVICGSAGTVEFQPNFESMERILYRLGQGTPLLCRVGTMSALCFQGEGGCEILSQASSVLGARFLPFPLGFQGQVFCGTHDSESVIAASAQGVVSISNGAEGFQPVAELAIRDITAACALGSDRFVFGSAHGEIEVLTLGSPRRMMRRAHAGAVQAIVRVGPDGFATGARDRALRAWHLDDQIREAWSIPELHDHFINCAVVSADEIWTGSSDGTIAVTSISRRQTLLTIGAHADTVRSLDASPDGRRIVSVSDEGTCCVIDVPGRTIVQRFGVPRQYNRSGAISLRGDHVRIAMGSTGGVLQIGSDEGLPFDRYEVSDASIRTLQFLGDHDLLIGEDSGQIRLVKREAILASFARPTGGSLTVVRATPNGERVLCGYRDGNIRIFSRATLWTDPAQSIPETVERSEDAAPFMVARRVHDSIVGDLVLLDDGELLSCSDDHTIKTLSAETLSVLKTTYLDHTAINNLLLVNRKLVATTDSGFAFVLDRRTHETVSCYAGHQGPVRAATSIGGGWVATGDRTGMVRVWNTSDLSTLCSYKFRERVIELGFEPLHHNLFVITESEAASLHIPKTWFASPSAPISPPPVVEHVSSVDIFVSYSRKDLALKTELESHLSLLRRQGRIRSWSDRDIDAGEEFDDKIKAELLRAEIVLLLVSADFVNSDYCYDIEVSIAMARHQAGTARVVPIVLRPCDWQTAPFGRLTALPRDGLAITKWTDRDDALLNVVAGLRAIIEQIAPADVAD